MLFYLRGFVQRPIKIDQRIPKWKLHNDRFAVFPERAAKERSLLLYLLAGLFCRKRKLLLVYFPDF